MENIELIQRKLKEILSIPSPTGYTHEVLTYLKKELKDIKIEYKVSNKGALLGILRGKDDKNQVTFSVHIDTLGAMVKDIKSNGRLVISQIGGYMINSIEGENCLVHTRNNKKISGTLQTIKPSIHIHADDASKLPRKWGNYEILLDENINSDNDVYKLGIQVGDIVSFDTRTKITNSNFIKSRYLDDKAGVCAILCAMNYIKKNNIVPKKTINFLFSNYEEVGHGSASFIPVNTSEFIAIDMGCVGDGQNSTEFDVSICTKDSNGPYDYDMINEFIRICKLEGINYKLDIYPNYGSDTTVALKAGLDARFALIGPGIYASHGYERTHVDSIIQTIKLIIAYINK